mmetsp:Transcript_3732/g.5604  ORF Transcript_3732/g.5604 Transcript_3732/m.5604 type:complete len:241 (+) Transcript_3732:381-1103(+)
MTGNYRYGGFPEISTKLYSHCNCDGQFSESKECRDFEAFKLMISDDARKMGLCYQTKNFSPFTFKWFTSLPDGKLNLDTSFVCNSDTKLKFIYLQGGAHFETNPESFVHFLIRPIFLSLNETIQNCLYKDIIQNRIRIAISGVNICAQHVWEKHPTQSVSKSIYFTKKLIEIMRERYPLVPVVIIDFLNMTNEAILDGRTSDGYHFLSDINMMKAMTIINLMHSMAIDTKYMVPFDITPS